MRRPCLHTGMRWGRLALVALLSVGARYSPAQAIRERIDNPPAWATDAIWYQIFPERFRNGDPKNDPAAGDILGSWPHEVPNNWRISPWTSDWYKLQQWEQADNKGFYFHVQQRRYGGDLQGVLDKLDYLKELGINAIYFNPLFESPSLHKYDATMYHHIDNNFGPDPEGDRRIWEEETPADARTWQWTSADKLFLTLIREAHQRGIRVVIDGVFNHVGMTFWAFQDVRTKGVKSEFKDWFTIKRWDDPTTPQDEFDYAGWNGVKELPEFRQDANGIVHGPREHIHDIVRRWMDPNGDGDPSDGVDGWRLDVAEKVAIPFWREFRTWVRGINPDAYLVGEVWWEDWRNDKMFNAAPWLQGDAFDAVMNYRWAREVLRFFAGDSTRITATEFDARLRSLRNDYRPEANVALMNLLDSHDTDRLGSQIVNRDFQYDHNVGVSDNRAYKVRKPRATEINTQKLIALFQMTYLGAPMIYYGDEAGMWGADDPDCRKPMLWPEMRFEDERSHPFGLPRPDDRNEFNDDLHAWYSTLTRIRASHPALRGGDFTTLYTDDKACMYAFRRSLNNQHVIVVVNASSLPHTARIASGVSGGQWVPLLGSSGNTHSATLVVSLEPMSGMIFASTGQ